MHAAAGTWGAQKAMAEKKFETALARLEELVKELEQGDLPLEQSLKLFEEGIKLSRICNSRLEEAERKVEILMKDKDGKIAAQPFEEEGQ
jgi:exodeoxyribonuclease VII small subunit